MKDGSTAIDVHTKPTVSPRPQNLFKSVQPNNFYSMRRVWEEPKQGEVEERCAGRTGTEILGEVGALTALVRPQATPNNNQRSPANVMKTGLTLRKEAAARLSAGIMSETKLPSSHSCPVNRQGLSVINQSSLSVETKPKALSGAYWLFAVRVWET
jgi:hypothetical protein